MSRFRDLPIRYKQMFIIMLTSSVALLLACAAFVFYEVSVFRRELVEGVSSLAEVMGHNTSAAIDFNDPAAAEQTLASLRGEENIVAAYLYKGARSFDGEAFAGYVTKDAPPPAGKRDISGPQHEFIGEYLHLFRPIKDGDGQIGTIELVANLGELRERMSRYAGIVAAVFISSLLVTFWLSTRLERLISQPILQLSRVARQVASQKDYSVRAQKQGNDELGHLVGDFNEMLVQIQERDAALMAAHDTLEQRVETRTKELAGSFALLNATLESTTDGILAMDLLGKITSFNTKFASIWQFTPEMLERRDAGEMSAHAARQVKDSQAFLNRLKSIFTNPEEEVFEVIELKDGRIFERYALPQRMDGKCVGVVVNWRDVTERKRAEADLAYERDLLKILLENFPDAIYFKDVECRFVRVSRAKLQRSYEVCLEQHRAANPAGRLEKLPAHLASLEKFADYLKGKTDADFFEAADAEMVLAEEREIIRTGKPVIGKLVQTRQLDGTLAWFLSTKMPWRDKDGHIIGTFGTSKNVTALKDVEMRLQYERYLLRALLDSCPDDIYFKDQNSRFIRASNSLARRFNFLSGDDLTGKSDFDFFADEHARTAFEDEQQIIRTGQPITGKMEKETWPDGRITWALTSKIPLRDAQGEIIGTFGISKDLTAMKEAEAKLEQVHRQLVDTSRQAGMAEVATSVLHNVGNVLNSVNTSGGVIAEKLKTSKVSGISRVAELFEKNKDNLIAFLSSDGRAEQVRKYLQTLSQNLVAEQTTILKEVQDLTNSIDHIKEIVAMQQTYAKVSGVVEIHSISTLFEDALRMYEGGLNRHGVKVVRDFDEIPPFPMDKHKTLQILVNLISNAKHALSDDNITEPTLTLALKRNGGAKVYATVQDNGVGIPPENLTRIFSHGFTTKKTGHGFGLHSGALAAREMGGSLRGHSEGLGKGTTFTLELPTQPNGWIVNDGEEPAI
jgi:PAS domain S-box-containing protein